MLLCLCPPRTVALYRPLTRCCVVQPELTAPGLVFAHGSARWAYTFRCWLGPFWAAPRGQRACRPPIVELVAEHLEQLVHTALKPFSGAMPSHWYCLCYPQGPMPEHRAWGLGYLHLRHALYEAALLSCLSPWLGRGLGSSWFGAEAGIRSEKMMVGYRFLSIGKLLMAPRSISS